ncbi:MAG: hypothetical protein IPF83_12215 [Rhodanobacteraceae bacterium]|nr:hypothetical protein [Rhodanobacteraceae bacterium]MBP9154069.1 hypothetical protein [Xanthomonadales bacterium]HQW82682.1 hypothetical protein [Pseudomonadota bacterium]
MSDEQWWIVTFGDMLHWARLTMNEDGNAEVLSANGETERFPNEGEARVALLDANYREFDGIDDDDAEEMGFELDSVAPPRANEGDEDDLLEQMTMKLQPR